MKRVSTDAAPIADLIFQTALGRRPDKHEADAAISLIRDVSQSQRTDMTVDLFAELNPQIGRSIRIGKHGFPPPATSGNHPKMTAPFTFAAVIQLDSLFPKANVRTIISQWDNQKTTRGWSIGITSEKSAFKPRNFILQPIGEGGYEVVASNLRPDLDRLYFAAVTVSQTEDGKGSATFYLQPVDAKYGQPETATVEFKTAAGFENSLPVVIGGRTKTNSHDWDGYIDQVALFNRCLDAESIRSLFKNHLQEDAVAKLQPTAFWNFNQEDQPGAGIADTIHSLEIKDRDQPTALEHAVAELCHVLVNSNEFVYID